MTHETKRKGRPISKSRPYNLGNVRISEANKNRLEEFQSMEIEGTRLTKADIIDLALDLLEIEQVVRELERQVKKKAQGGE